MPKTKPSTSKKPPEARSDLPATVGYVDRIHDSIRHSIFSFEHIDARYEIKAVIEQNQAENRIALEHLSTLFTRQDRVERRLDDFERNLPSKIREVIKG